MRATLGALHISGLGPFPPEAAPPLAAPVASADEPEGRPRPPARTRRPSAARLRRRFRPPDPAELEPVLPPRTRIALRAPGRASRFLEVVPRREETVDHGEVELAPGGGLAGRVVEERGAPAAGWTARLVERGYARSALALPAATVGAAGAFELAAPAGAYDLELRAPAGAAAELVVLRPVELAGEVVLWSGELATATLAGRVEPGARLRLVRGRFDEGEREHTTFAAGPDGHFDLAGLPAGRASLQRETDGAYGLGWYPLAEVELLAGKRVELE